MLLMPEASWARILVGTVTPLGALVAIAGVLWLPLMVASICVFVDRNGRPLDGWECWIARAMVVDQIIVLSCAWALPLLDTYGINVVPWFATWR